MPKKKRREQFERVSLEPNRIRSLLTELDKEITSGHAIRFVVVGGEALALEWGYRATGDVDFINDNLPSEIRQAIAAVGERNGLTSDWMNDAAKIKMPNVKSLPPEYHLLFTGKKIRVYSPGSKFLLAMKLLSSRPHDFADCVFLVQQTSLKTHQELLDLIQKGYPTLRIPVKCQYFAESVIKAAAKNPGRN